MSNAPGFYPFSKPAKYEEVGIPLADHHYRSEPLRPPAGPYGGPYEGPYQAPYGSGYNGGVWVQETPAPGAAPQPRQPVVNWVVGWRSPTLMLGLFFSATALAVGHHLYYSSLDGTPVQPVVSQWNIEGLRDSQEWKIRFGSAFGFLVKALYAGAVATAYQEYTWVLVRRTAISIEGLDALFAAGHNFLSFFSREYLVKAKFGVLLAMLIWLIPFSALVTPATLTVVPATTNVVQDLRVPTVNFTNFDPLYNYTVSDLMSDVRTSDNGLTPYMTRLVTSTSSALEILPMAPLRNSSYNMTFHGPSFRCEKPSTHVDDAIYQVLNATNYKSTLLPMKSRYDTNFAWLAFTPNSVILNAMVDNTNLSKVSEVFLGYAVSCITGFKSSDDASRSSQQCEGITIPQPMLNQARVNSTFVRSLDTNLNYGRLWVWAQNETYDCVLSDTVYEANFAYSASEDVQRIDPGYKFTWTDEDLYGNYFVLGNAVANLLEGAIWGYLSGILSYKTRVSQTAIFGSLRATTAGSDASHYGLSPALMSEDIKALARGRTAGELIEELSRNLTLSMFSAEKVLASTGNSTTVLTSTLMNVYAYNRLVLIVTYAVAFLAALIGVLIGILSYRSNGVGHNTSFSAFMRTTRNRTLDALTQGQSLGADPMSWDLSRTRLRFGLLMNEEPKTLGVGPDGLAVPLRRTGFGLEEEVMPLRKGAPCY